MAQTFDVIVLGGGPGGTTAARMLARGGKKVALVEDAHLGGTCVNCGCIPTKILLAATAPGGLLHDHKRFGSVEGEVRVNLTALQQRKDRFVKGSVMALAKTLTTAGVTLFTGRGRAVAPGEVVVEGETSAALCAPHIILATGSRPAAFPGLEPDGEAVLDSTMLLRVAEAPESLIIVGAGAIGMEFSDFFSHLGSAVTIVEGLPQLVPTEDADIARELRKIVEKSGRICMTGERVASLATRDGAALLTFADGRTLTAQKALVAVGRRPNTENLGVDVLGGALTPRGFVAVDASLRAAPGVYAVGDVNGVALLAHPADHQAAYVARRILGEDDAPYASGPIPSCIFGHVEVMRVGKTAREVLAAGGSPAVSKVPFSINPIAQAHASNVGLAKAVWDGDRLVGMAALGHGASHLVTAAQLLVMGDYTPEKLHSFMFAHPTLDEILASAINAPRTPYTE